MNRESITIAQALNEIRPADADAMRRAEDRQLTLTKPPGSLGRLEEISIRLAGILGTERPRIGGKAVIVAAADHGVVAQGVTGYPQEVTAQMVLNFLGKGAAVSVMSEMLGVRQIIVDAGVVADLPPRPELRSMKISRGSNDISIGPAMSRELAERCVEAGINLAVEVIESGADLVAAGDMGIGNTTPSSAITAAVIGRPPDETTGEGTGRAPDELRSKIEVVRAALRVNGPDANDGLDVLSKVGGFEIGMLAGVILGTAMMRKAAILDGFISGAAALVAHTLCPISRDYMIASHVSAERGHRLALAHLELSPLLDLGMRLGEGTGAVLAMPIVETAVACLSDMATFDEAGVSDREQNTEEI